MTLAGKVALVTGAASGIGRAIALRFAAARATLIATDIDAAGAGATAREAGRDALHLRLDVSDETEVARVYAAVAARHGRLDIQVSNAGITARAPFLEMTLEKFDRIIRTNLYGVFLCGQQAARLMQGGGRIVNIASVSGQQGGTGRSAYGASKAAIINLTQTMAIELAPRHILVNAIAPGPTQIERFNVAGAQRAALLSRLAIKRFADPAEVASAALFLVSAENTYITGHVLNVDGGFHAAGVMYDPDTAN
ncbi:MAG: SDR family oxidoreductase [Betaproteobacteria bacterium]|nr:SDR family oxidoreductase [Betaproteobacteria bacterium]